MAGEQGVNNAAENVGSSDAMDYTSVGNASGTRQKKWGLKNTIRGC